MLKIVLTLGLLFGVCSYSFAQEAKDLKEAVTETSIASRKIDDKTSEVTIVQKVDIKDIEARIANIQKRKIEDMERYDKAIARLKLLIGSN